jgi:Fic family protein
MRNHIRHSNLIEGIDDPAEDQRSLETWEWLKDKPNITYKRLMHVHRSITLKQLRDDQAGHVRTVNVKVGDFFPPAPTLVELLLREWLIDMMGWKRQDPKDMHVRFERIHPFVDGNGRTGRMLMWWHELKLGQEPTLIRSNEADKHYYYQWFKEDLHG